MPSFKTNTKNISPIFLVYLPHKIVLVKFRTVKLLPTVKKNLTNLFLNDTRCVPSLDLSAAGKCVPFCSKFHWNTFFHSYVYNLKVNLFCGI